MKKNDKGSWLPGALLMGLFLGVIGAVISIGSEEWGFWGLVWRAAVALVLGSVILGVIVSRIMGKAQKEPTSENEHGR